MSALPPKREMPYVHLGKSGPKISRIILGCMSYGTPEWEKWVLPEEESIKIIKAAYDAGINAFDTSNVYSNGVSEIVLGKAIKQNNLPREEIVVMTKVYFPVCKEPGSQWLHDADADKAGYVNQSTLCKIMPLQTIHINAKPLQSCLPRGRARNDATLKQVSPRLLVASSRDQLKRKQKEARQTVHF